MIKTNKKWAIAIMLLILIAVTGCSNKKINETDVNTEDINEVSNQDGKRIVVDGAGREVEIPEDVESIICWNVGALRYTSYMQAQDLVVGVEDYEKEQAFTRPYNYVNSELFKELPIVGSNGEHYLEEAIAVGPDIIIMSALDKGDADAIEEATGIPVVLVPGSDKMMDENAYETFRIMGEVYKKEDRATELINYLDGIKEDLENRTGDIAEEEKPTVYVGGVSFKGAHGLDGTEAFYGPLHWINAKNLANETDQNGPFNADLEQILEWDPDVLFIDYNGLELINESYEKDREYYENLRAVQEGEVYSQISFRSFAANLDMALINTYYAGKILYPESFQDIDPVQKADEIFNELLGTDFYHVLKENGHEFRKVTIGE